MYPPAIHSANYEEYYPCLPDHHTFYGVRVMLQKLPIVSIMLYYQTKVQYYKCIVSFYAMCNAPNIMYHV